jgi:hypothetical protein
LECGSALLCRFGFCVLSLFFRIAQEHQEKQEIPKRQSKALPHSKKRQTGTRSGWWQLGGDSCTTPGETQLQ